MNDNENHDPPDLGSPQYWETKYQQADELYEWYQPWACFGDYVIPYLSKSGRILNVGTGNSPMSHEMTNDTQAIIYNIDISQTVISQMRKRFENDSQNKWEVMDCTNLKYDDNYFDCVIEKGTIDALSCRSDSNEVIEKMLKEICRVLKPDGFFISLSFGNEGQRAYHFKNKKIDWEFNGPILIPKIMLINCFYYMYVTKKKSYTAI